MKRLAALLFAILLVLAFGGRAARAEDTLDAIRKRGTLIIGTDATYPPMESLTGDRFEGFDIDLGNEIGKELGVKTQWVNINWDGAFPALLVGKFDLLVSSVAITDKRKKTLAFSRPYFLSGESIVRRNDDSRIGKFDDLRNKRVTVQIGTTGQFALEKAGIPKERIGKFSTMQLALLEVRNGNADASVGDFIALREMIRKGYPELEIVGDVFVRENTGVVARPGDQTLLAAVNAALTHIMADGRYAAIYRKDLGDPFDEYIAKLNKVKDEGTPITDKAALAKSKAEATSARRPRGGSAFAIHWTQLRETLPLLLKGAVETLKLTALTLLIGVPLGLFVALGRISHLGPLRAAAVVYIEVIRGTPLLMQIFVIYFVLPALGLKLSQEVAAITALSLNAGAYIAEIFRAGIESIDSGQMEAARSLGMDYAAAMRWVILPQTIRVVLPPMTNEAVALLKDSSLVSVIGLAELMRVGQEQASVTGSAFTIYLAVALLYLAMTLPLTYLVRKLEVAWRPISRAAR